MKIPERIAAISMPVPVNESHVKAKTAASGVGFATTGGTLSIMLCSPGTGKFHVKIGLTAALNQPVPQTSRIAHTMIQGVSAFQTSARVGFTLETTGTGAVPAESSCVRSLGEVQTVFGFQIFRKPIRQAIEMSDAPMSTIQGLTKFEIRYCGTANETPVTRIAGQISFMPRKPANTQISQNGTISEKNGSCRPTIAPRRYGSRPVTDASPAIGVPSAP